MAADLVLTDAEADGAMAAYQTYLVHYDELLQLSLDRKERNYNLVFKHHHMWHIVDHARFINPRYIWCYEFEDICFKTISRQLARPKASIISLGRNAALSRRRIGWAC